MTALDSVRVLDLSQGIASSVTGMLAADFGADVIKVERPSGDPTRSNPGFAVWNRGKRSVVVDPQVDADRRWLAASVAGADVCILGPNQSFDDWGVEVADAAASNGRLVELRMPAYLSTGTPWVGGGESNALLAAHAAVAWRQSSEDGTPVEWVDPHLLYIQGLWSAVCLVSALLEREKSDHGQRVVVTGVNAVMEATVYSLSVDPNAPDPSTAVGSLGRHPTYRPVRAQDGWMTSGALGPKFETTLLEILGITHILDDPRLAGSTQNMVHPDHVVWSMEQVSAAFLTRPRDHWIAALRERGIPAGPLLGRDEWLDHPQVSANGLRVEVDDPERGRVAMPGVPIVLTKTPGAVRAPAPTLGQHTGDQPWGPQPQPAGSATISPGPLAGYKILDMGTFVASPYAGFLLAELGADVIKVEPVTGDPFRTSAFTVNRGMRSLGVNLATPTGHDIFRGLNDSADVLIDGMRPGVMAKLGIDYDSLRTTNEDIITVSLAAFGMHGELASAGGVDVVVQGFSGMMLAQGTDEQPISSTTAIIDVTTAAMTALASVLALFHRERTGEGQRTWDSLVGTSTFLQLGELAQFEGRTPARRGGVDFKGHGPLDRFYEVSDGWVRVETISEVTADDLRAHGIDVHDISIEAIGKAVSDLAGAAVVEAFALAGVPAVIARKVSQLFSDPDLTEAQLVHVREADAGGFLVFPGRYAAFSRTQRSGPLTPPGIGEHSIDILREAGLDDEQVQAAIGEGAVVVGERMPVALALSYR